jgi:hypothetical protein
MGLTISTEGAGFPPRGAAGSFKLPFQEQIDFFNQKNPLPSQHYDDILKSAHDRAFIVAGAAKADLLNDLHGAVKQTINEGKTLDWFRGQFDAIVKKHGWTGWTGENSAAGVAWRTRVIYQTNLSTSYAAGRWAQLNDPDLLSVRPYWKYIHNDSVAHPRELHKSWNGVVLPHDHPWWLTHFCPNGWGCRCRIMAVRATEYKGKPAPNDGTYQHIDRNGVAHTLPKGIDYGFDYAPSQSLTKSLVANKAAVLPDKLANAFLAEAKKVSADKVNPLLRANQAQIAVADYLKLYEFKNVAKQLKNKELAQTLGLTQAEHSMIHTYTANGFMDINRLLYGLEPYKENTRSVLQPATEVLSQALAKLKPYKGKVVRCLSLPTEKLAAYQIDAIVKHDAFTSASTSAEDVFVGEPIRMIIFSKTGKRIELFSTKPDEKEVLFDKGTSFKVKDILRIVVNGQEITKITLQEI